MNRLAWAAPAAFSLLAAAATTAHAQGAPPPPPPMPDPTTPSGAYPLALVDRPLMLPSSMLEVDGHFWIPTSDGIDLFDVVSAVVSARYSTGSFEPFAGLELVLVQPEGSTASSLLNLFGGVRAPAGPGTTKATFNRYAPIDGFSIITIDGRFEYKQKLGEKLAVVAEGGLAFNLLSIDIGGMSDSGNSLNLIGRGAGQVQLAPMAAIQGGLQLTLPIASSDNINTNTVTQLFGEVLYAMEKFDVFARMEITIAGADEGQESSSQTAFILGVLARPM